MSPFCLVTSTIPCYFIDTFLWREMKIFGFFITSKQVVIENKSYFSGETMIASLMK